MSDNSFFAELQAEFLAESAFMLENYEESMLGLENGENPLEDLAQIFRVAHSVKGGAAAVGLPDLSKFAHVMEDLLALLRMNPSLVNSTVISVLLQSGDMLKKRITALQAGDNSLWDTSELVTELKSLIAEVSGESNSTNNNSNSNTEETNNNSNLEMSNDLTNKENNEDVQFFIDEKPEDRKLSAEDQNKLIQSNLIPDNVIPLKDPAKDHPKMNEVEDHTNHELLEELKQQFGESIVGNNTQKMTSEKASQSVSSVSSVELPLSPPEAGMKPVNKDEPSKVVASASVSGATSVTNTTVKSEKTNAPENKKVNSSNATANAGNSGGSNNSSSGSGSSSSGGKNQRQLNSSIKVDTARVDSVLDAVGELVVLKNQLVHDDAVRGGNNVRLAAIVDQLDKTVRELYDKTLSIRMTPLKSLFLKIQRIVRDVSLTLNKPVDLQLVGEETEVERTVFELLGDPLVHLVRNAMDHGIEKPEIRAEKGKPTTAKVVVQAKQSGGSVLIEIVDDGGGINRAKVIKKAQEKGLIAAGTDVDSMPDEQVYQFIFAPGFSTADKVSDLSGRGVGLDVVKSNLERINGKIDIKSKPDVGTTFRLSIPLSTAITDGIVVAIENSKYIMPIHSIREIVRVVPQDFTNISKAGRVVKIREILMPVIDIRKTIGKINWEQLESAKYQVDAHRNSLRARREESMLIIIESMYGMMALPVDDVIGQAQVVVKALTTGHDIPEVAGAAIMGDGRTVLILDPMALTQSRKLENLEVSA